MEHVRKAHFFQAQARLDERSFEAVFSEHYNRVYEILFRLTGDPHEADDLAAETFWRLWERPPAARENLGGWLYRVALHLGFNAKRSGRRRAQYETRAVLQALEEQPQADPAREAELSSEREQVRAVLFQMPDRDAQILILRHSGLTYQEVADTLQIAPNSIGTLLNRAEKRFEALYRKGEDNAPE